jgi:hypothetical protein
MHNHSLVVLTCTYSSHVSKVRMLSLYMVRKLVQELIIEKLILEKLTVTIPILRLHHILDSCFRKIVTACSII